MGWQQRELKTLSDSAGPSGHQKLQVCDVCGAYLSRLDNDRRLADHFYGKVFISVAYHEMKLVELTYGDALGLRANALNSQKDPGRAWSPQHHRYSPRLRQ
jgi:hypothetical protein